MRTPNIAPFILACIAAQSSQDLGIEQEIERKILVSLYESTSGASWTKNENWNNPQVHFCDWHGIQCVDSESSSRRRVEDNQGKSIQSIDLAENNLRGSVPISLLLLLPNIRSIRLNGNDVDYTKVAEQEVDVLDQVLDLPISVQSSVQHFDVSHTSVKDIVRLFRAGNGSTIINTPFLETFYASESELRGHFPEFLVSCARLERLSMDHNSLTGTLPSTLGNLSKLKYLSLADNSLSGMLPASFLSLVKLSFVILENNRFSGTIPVALTSGEYTPLLEQLDLSNQRDASMRPSSKAGLSGNVPQFNSHKLLRRVDLGFNSIAGTIPSDLLSDIDFAEFDFIILSSNLISGTVPSSVVNRIPIDGLFLDNNKITGLTTCPASDFGCDAILCPPGTYEPRSGRQEVDSRPCLDCPQNKIYWGQTFCRVEQVAPTFGPLLPTSPPARSPIGSPVTAEPTIFPTQSPSEGIPFVQVDEKAVLLDLYISTGGTNWSNSNGWALPNTSASVCDWYGVICDDSMSVKFLNLDNNNLLGQLSESIFTLPNLKSLDLSQNVGLTVTFAGIGKARSLESLDVSKTVLQNVEGILDATPRLQEIRLNDVSGFEGQPLPSEFFSLTNLRQLSMDYNNAIGKLPTDLGNLSNLVIFSVSNNELTGTIPSSIASLTNLATLRLSSNHMTGTLPNALESLQSLSVLDLSNQWSNGVDDDFAENGKPGFNGRLPSFAMLSQIRTLDVGVNSLTGTIPDNFLESVDTENIFEFAELGDNYLTGTVPSGVARLQNLYMAGNFIEQIAQEVCDGVTEELQSFGCDAVLCRPGTYNQLGRQTAEDKPCLVCNDTGAAKFFGANDCFESLNRPSSSPARPNVPEEPEIQARQALEQIYNECDGAGWTARDNWMDNTVSICLWEGILCDENNSVSEIMLRSNLLNGTFPSYYVFENIPTLTSLVLDGNSVFFPFDGITQASNLATLDLTQTDLDSVKGLGESPKLENLYLSSNDLRGPIPSEILVLTSLKRLALAYNDLTGTIPVTFVEMSSLEFLSLHHNGLNGTIPSQLGQLNKLLFLLMESNTLSGSLPTELNFLRSLNILSLSDQRGSNGLGLIGRIPSFATLTNLKSLDLSRNALSGTIPYDFLDNVSVQSFEYLSLAKNSLTGELPNILSKFPVEQYDVTDNKISKLGDGLCSRDLNGAVEKFGCNAVLCPIGTWGVYGRQLNTNDGCETCVENPYFGATQCLGSNASSPTLPPITTSNLSDESILSLLFDETNGISWKRKENWKKSGVSICEWFGVQCDFDGNGRVEHLQLSENNLVGIIPTEIFALPYLKSLVIDSNRVRVSFDGIKSARRLEMLDVSNTQIDNMRGIDSAQQLLELHIKKTGQGGAFPVEIFKLTTLQQLDFDFNSFSGPLSHLIGQLSNLKLLSGESNLLSGVLPNEIGALTDLESLRLGRNSFGGNLPADALNKMSSLTYIDLSRQKEHGGPGLSGPLPPLSSLKHISQIRLKGNALSGTVPFNFLQAVNSAEFEYADLSSNTLTGTLPASLARYGELYLFDNFISGVPSAFCDVSKGTMYSQFGCDAFLCEVGTYNLQGRQESNDTPCEDCPDAKYFGSIHCGDDGPSEPRPLVVEQDVLVKLYETCGGENWDEQENWRSENKTICSWAGVKCVPGREDTVEALELGANNLIGSLPTEIFALSNLKSLALYSNPFSNISFDGIQFAQNLTELLLDATGVSSVKGIERAPSLKLLNLRFNDLEGTFPSELTKLTSLETLTLAYNALTGTLPSAIEGMTNLEALLMSHNEISGNLENVDFPASIRRLDLSDNHLLGSIPDSFLTLIPFSAELEIDLSSNRLTGSIPTDLTRFMNLNIYLKDNQLTEMSDELCSMNDWNEGDVGRFGCNGILCPIGYVAPNGRHTAVGECQECVSGRALHLGASKCDESSSGSLYSTVRTLLIAGACWTLMAFG